MARKPIIRDLPSLSLLLRNVGSEDARMSKQSVLTTQLRDISLRLQKDTHQPFYSMREVVDHFDLPLRSVALAYEALEREGLLNRCRGSQTLLVGRQISPRKHVRAVVGIPVWAQTMVVSSYSRSFHAELEDRLRQQGFVASLVFFDQKDLIHPEFTERMLAHDFDYVFWHTPHPQALNALLSLRDRGIHQISVQSTDSRLNIPLPGYLQDWQAAYEEMADAWQKAGIRHVIVPVFFRPVAPGTKVMFLQIMKERAITVQFLEGDALALRAAVASRSAGRCAVAFLDQTGADALCNENPVAMEAIMQESRVAFCRGLIRMPYFDRRKACVDVVHFSPHEMARHIANDLKETFLSRPQVLRTFRATYQPLIPLSGRSELL